MAGSNSARGMYEQFHATWQRTGSYLSLGQRKKRPAFYGTKEFNNVHTTHYWTIPPPPPPPPPSSSSSSSSSSVVPLSKKDKRLHNCSPPFIPNLCYLPPINNVHLSYVILYIIFPSSLGSLYRVNWLDIFSWCFLHHPSSVDDPPI